MAVAALLPVLDATTMGWKHRDFYLDPEHTPYLFDTNGNAGPTVWCDGRIIGGPICADSYNWWNVRVLSSTPFEGSPQPYTMFNRSGEIPVAGVMTVPADVNAPPFWAMYVGVPYAPVSPAYSLPRITISRLSSERSMLVLLVI